MIEYSKGPYSLNTIFQVQGSILYASLLPGLFSVIIFTLFRNVYGLKNEKDDLKLPDVVGLLVSSVSLILVFHANACYERYWEACTAVHVMMGQWMDAAVQTACCHMQCSHYDRIKPPSLFHHPDTINPNVYTDRQIESNNVFIYSPYRRPSARSIPLRQSFSIERFDSKQSQIELFDKDLQMKMQTQKSNSLLGNRMDGGWGMLFSNDNDTKTSPLYSDVVTRYAHAAPEIYNTIPVNASWAREKTPSLFLQELAHLSSLCVAVAFCTLRDNNSDKCIEPLRSYKIHQPWPPTNPFDEVKLNHVGLSRIDKIKQLFQFFLSINRFKDQKKKFCFNRPMYVLGGISKNELAALRRAKGTSAKITLVSFWLSEFITREHLAGTLGTVGSPIVSRVHQFLSDGMNQYNTAMKIMFVPFPYPHEQLSSVVVIPLLILLPFMMSEYTSRYWIGAALSFLTTTCLFGVLEVARELDSPFQNIPNEVPLCTLLAMHNESLIAMCSGFHPNHYWETPNSNMNVRPQIQEQT